MQTYNGLMRYHSAPSSVLASLLDEDTHPQVSDAYMQVELDPEFAQFLDDHLCTMVNPQLGSKPLPSTGFHSLPPFTAEEARACLADSEIRPLTHSIERKSSALQQPPCMPKSIKDVFRGPLSSISELRTDESNQFCRLDAQMKMGGASHWPKPPDVPIPNEGGLAYVKNQLARQNSSPADFLSRLIIEEGNVETVLHFGGPSTQNFGKGSMLNHDSATSLLPASGLSCYDQVNYTSKSEDGKGVFVETNTVKSPADERRGNLRRQNSSPAGLLSQLCFSGTSTSLICTKLATSPLSEKSFEEERRGGSYEAARFWDEIDYDKAGLEHRKRGREDIGIHRPQSSEISFTNQKDPQGDSLVKIHGNGLVRMEVFCRESAKRGCATHPRSIAERVRRTKINEGIRKLQELMPNMEKQTNTVALLDEAVEYVKFLQRQVEELLESRPKCNGRCNPKGNA